MKYKTFNANILGVKRSRLNLAIILTLIAFCIFLIYKSEYVNLSSVSYEFYSNEYISISPNKTNDQTEKSIQNVSVDTEILPNLEHKVQKRSVDTEITTTTQKTTTTEKRLISEENMKILEQSVIDSQREKIAAEMKNFPYTKKMVGLSALTPETGGKPVRSVILSTWRSGSSFFGDILNAVPGTYYHFEPLAHFGDIQIRSYREDSIETIHQLLTCNFTGQHNYLGRAMFHYNPRLFKFCDAFSPFELCRKLDFLSKFCSLFPFQALKLVRIRAIFSELLLRDPATDVKIVLLIRDPRGVMASRYREQWCTVYYECRNSTNVCNDMISDYKAARYLTYRYPRRFTVVRYEDLALDPSKVTGRVLKFYELPFHGDVRKFLKQHTTYNSGTSMSTFRNSKDTAFSWLQNLNFTEIERLQSECKEALNLCGYNLISNESELSQGKFNPLSDYSFDMNPEEAEETEQSGESGELEEIEETE